MPSCVLFQFIISLVILGFCDNHNTGNLDGKTERVCLACYSNISIIEAAIDVKLGVVLNIDVKRSLVFALLVKGYFHLAEVGR